MLMAIPGCRRDPKTPMNASNRLGTMIPLRQPRDDNQFITR
jgi:hypothetical protein